MLMGSKVTDEGQRSGKVNMWDGLKMEKLTHLHTGGPISTMWPQKVRGQSRVSICIIHKLQRQVTQVVLAGPQSIFYLWLKAYSQIPDWGRSQKF